jgi:hypothetical protein
LNLSSHSSRSCAGPNIKLLKDKDLEFANSIRSFLAYLFAPYDLLLQGVRNVCHKPCHNQCAST